MKIVQFKNGTYGIRRFDLFELSYVYWDYHKWRWSTAKQFDNIGWREYPHLSDAQAKFNHLVEEEVRDREMRARRRDRGIPFKS